MAAMARHAWLPNLATTEAASLAINSCTSTITTQPASGAAMHVYDTCMIHTLRMCINICIYIYVYIYIQYTCRHNLSQILENSKNAEHQQIRSHLHSTVNKGLIMGMHHPLKLVGSPRISHTFWVWCSPMKNGPKKNNWTTGRGLPFISWFKTPTNWPQC